MQLQEKEDKEQKQMGKLVKKQTDKRCLSNLNFKPFRSYVNGKLSTDMEFHSIVVQRKKLLT